MVSRAQGACTSISGDRWLSILALFWSLVAWDTLNKPLDLSAPVYSFVKRRGSPRDQNHLEKLVSEIGGAGFLTWQVWGGARASVFLTSSQVMLVLLVGDHALRDTVYAQTFARQTLIMTLIALKTLLFDKAGDTALGKN